MRIKDYIYNIVIGPIYKAKLKKYIKIKKQLEFLGGVGKSFPYLSSEQGQIFRQNKSTNKKFNYGVNSYYSQCGQDYIVNFLFGGKRDGFFLDIGGNDPIMINNTYYFEQLGWSGLAFEPLKKYVDKWKERKTECIQIALGNSEEEIEFVEAKKDYLSRRLDGKLIETVNLDEAEIIEKYVVKQRKLSDVLNERGIHNIDYMSLDVEGAEFDILEGINWEKDIIKVISVENEDGFNMENKIRDYLYSKGYIYWARIEQDDIFILDEEFNNSDKK